MCDVDGVGAYSGIQEISGRRYHCRRTRGNKRELSVTLRQTGSTITRPRTVTPSNNPPATGPKKTAIAQKQFRVAIAKKLQLQF